MAKCGPKYQQIQTIKCLTVQGLDINGPFPVTMLPNTRSQIQVSRAIVTTLAPTAVDARRGLLNLVQVRH